MKFTAAALALAASASATTFTVKSIITESGLPLATTGWAAVQGNILDATTNADASCDRGVKNPFATFSLADDSSLYLYKTDNPPQQLYADLSGMGQGKLGFSTGVQPIPGKAGRTGWAIDASTNVLTFSGNNFIACPNSALGGFSIWVSAGTANPGGNSNCVAVQAVVEKVKEPVGCLYTSSP